MHLKVSKLCANTVGLFTGHSVFQIVMSHRPTSYKSIAFAMCIGEYLRHVQRPTQLNTVSL